MRSRSRGTVSAASGAIRAPIADITKGKSSISRAPAPSLWRERGPPRWRSSARSRGGPGPRAGAVSDEGLDRLVAEVFDRGMAAEPRHRLLRIHVDTAETGGGDLVEVVHDR